MHIEVIEPEGYLNSTNVNNFRQQARNVLENKPDVILIDMKYLKQMDSSGLGALLFVLRSASAIECKLALCSINEYVGFLIEATSMKDLFKIFKNRNQFESSLEKVKF